MARLSSEEIEQRERNRMNFEKTLKENNGGLDFEAMRKGAEAEEQERLVQSKMYEAREQARLQAEQEKIQGLISGLSEHVDKEKKENAEREFEKAKAKADEALQKKIYDKHLVKTDKQIAKEDSLRSMLKDLK